MNKLTIAILAALFWLIGSAPVRAQEGTFYHGNEAFSSTLLRPWVEKESQAGYAGLYLNEFKHGNGRLIVDVHVKNGTNHLLLDAVKIGPGDALGKKPVRIFEDFFVREDGGVHIGGKEVMKACTFVHPKSKRKLRGFLMNAAFFSREE